MARQYCQYRITPEVLPRKYCFKRIVLKIGVVEGLHNGSKEERPFGSVMIRPARISPRIRRRLRQGNRILNSLDNKGMEDRTNETNGTYRTYRIFFRWIESAPQVLLVLVLLFLICPIGPIGPNSPTGLTCPTCPINHPLSVR